MKSGTCPKCGHNEVIESVPAECGNGDLERRMAVTADPRWLFPGRNPKNEHGALTVYTCRRCGFCEWYASHPGEIPLGEEYKTRLIEGS